MLLHGTVLSVNKCLIYLTFVLMWKQCSGQTSCPLWLKEIIPPMSFPITAVGQFRVNVSRPGCVKIILVIGVIGISFCRVDLISLASWAFMACLFSCMVWIKFRVGGEMWKSCRGQRVKNEGQRPAAGSHWTHRATGEWPEHTPRQSYGPFFLSH